MSEQGVQHRAHAELHTGSDCWRTGKRDAPRGEKPWHGVTAQGTALPGTLGHPGAAGGLVFAAGLKETELRRVAFSLALPSPRHRCLG